MQKEIYFQVGDKVTCLLYGKGIVVNPKEKHGSYCLKVKFQDEIVKSYTYDGRYLLNQKPCLFQGHIDINLPTNKPIYQFKKGDLVWVKSRRASTWECRFFSHMENGLYNCFVSQAKEGDITDWELCLPYNKRPF